ncbi:type II toxin-antitoxin system PemK/MazF family toxin [Patescibacteria group bacterium]|nr:MAG: type II toxin-antitoxin system PemK/MazF family toxin [Patescibacteria group bacterium]
MKAKYQSLTRGDVVWANLSPSKGSEQRGLRPVIILTPTIYHAKSGIIVVCPVTSRSKGYPFEVPLPLSGTVRGVALCDQIRSIHVTSRVKGFAGQVSSRTLAEIEEKLKILLQFS